MDMWIRPVELSDLDSMLSLFCECFSDSIDYCGCDSSNLRRYANESLAHFFQSTPKKYFSACRVAVKGDRVIGCCMIECGKHGPLLQPIFIAPEYQRCGIATRLLLEAVQTLSASGEMRLHSRCNLGNEPSLAWHLHCRFEEIPSRWTAGHRANIYSQEAERQKMLQLPTANDIRELADYWADQRDRLENEPTLDL
jgi:GNAT superfamily N-acetyltransferase